MITWFVFALWGDQGQNKYLRKASEKVMELRFLNNSLYNEVLGIISAIIFQFGVLYHTEFHFLWLLLFFSVIEDIALIEFKSGGHRNAQCKTKESP